MRAINPFLEQIPQLWRAESLARARGPIISTGFAALDAALGGGWLHPALIELLSDHAGIGELQLLLPLVKYLTQPAPATSASEVPLAIWCNPPHALHAVALLQHGLMPARHWISGPLSDRDTAWAMDQALRSGACALVVGWVHRLTMPATRRLKLATHTGRTLAVLCRPRSAARSPSAATIRAELQPRELMLDVRIHKAPGRPPATVTLDVSGRVPLRRSAP